MLLQPDLMFLRHSSAERFHRSGVFCLVFYNVALCVEMQGARIKSLKELSITEGFFFLQSLIT